jgi:hypothetical protein
MLEESDLPKKKEKTVTGDDDTWVFRYYPETKHRILQWKSSVFETENSANF